GAAGRHLRRGHGLHGHAGGRRPVRLRAVPGRRHRPRALSPLAGARRADRARQSRDLRDRPVGHQQRLQGRAPDPPVRLEQQLSPFQPQPQHGRTDAGRGAHGEGAADDLPRPRAPVGAGAAGRAAAMRRREFVKAGAALSMLGQAHLWEGYDFGPGPRAPDRLDQGPFGIEQDEGWYTIETTTFSREPLRNFGLGLVGYTWEENGPALAVRSGTAPLEQAVEKLAALPFVDVLYIRCD